MNVCHCHDHFIESAYFCPQLCYVQLGCVKVVSSDQNKHTLLENHSRPKVASPSSRVLQDQFYPCPSHKHDNLHNGTTPFFTTSIYSQTPHDTNSLTQPQADKLRTAQALEALQHRHVGTGHADTSKFEWASNVHRDTKASIVGHPPLLQYVAVGMGVSREEARATMIEGMVHPVGAPPEREE